MVTPMVIKHKTLLNSVSHPELPDGRGWVGFNFKVSVNSSGDVIANQHFDCQPKPKSPTLRFIEPLGNWMIVPAIGHQTVCLSGSIGSVTTVQ